MSPESHIFSRLSAASAPVPLILCALLSLGSGCTESLPPYAVPEDVWDLRLYSTVPDPSRIRNDIDLVQQGRSPLSLNITLQNIFDETLQGAKPARLGKVDIWLNSDPNAMRTLDILPNNEYGTYIFNSTLYAAIDPGDSSTFLIAWYGWLDNRNTPFWTYTSVDSKTEDALHIYTNYRPLAFTAQASMQPIEGGPNVYSNQFSFTVTFYTVRRK